MWALYAKTRHFEILGKWETEIQGNNIFNHWLKCKVELLCWWIHNGPSLLGYIGFYSQTKLGHFSANIFIIKLGRMFGTIINLTRNVWWLAGLPAMSVDQGCHIVRTNGMSYIYKSHPPSFTLLCTFVQTKQTPAPFPLCGWCHL